MEMTLDLYVDYLLCSTSYTTATGLSRLVDNAISHDRVTRFLSKNEFTAADLWNIAKARYRSIKSENGALIIDNSLEEKPYTDENELVAWHYDHAKGVNVKGLNFLTALYEASNGNIPVGVDLVKKDKKVTDKKTGKERRKASISMQEQYRALIKQAVANDIIFKYVLNDSWFASVENMRFVKQEMGKDFIMPLKINRKVFLSPEDRASERFVGIDSLEPGESKLVWLQGADFPLRLVRHHFKDGDGHDCVIYLVSSIIELTGVQIAEIYHRRWKIEVYHKSLKNNASLAASPTKTPRTQSNHLFASICAYIQLERITSNAKTNHFAFKQKIYLAALKRAMFELQKYCAPIFQTANSARGAA